MAAGDNGKILFKLNVKYGDTHILSGFSPRLTWLDHSITDLAIKQYVIMHAMFFWHSLYLYNIINVQQENAKFVSKLQNTLLIISLSILDMFMLHVFV